MITTKKHIFLLPVLFFISSFSFFSQTSELITITRAAFCLNINNREPANKISGTVNVSADESIYFWMEFIGNRRAFAILEANGELKIWHEWRRGIYVTDRIMVGITQEKWIENRERIRLELRARGFFTWRTFSYKKIAARGQLKLKIKIYDDDGCEIPSGTDQLIQIFLK